MYPKDADKKFNIKTEAIGTGAYKLKEFVPADRVVYEKNPNYRNKDFPKNEGIFGMTYEVVGPPGNATLRVMPMSVFAPGIFRKMFEFRNADDRAAVPPTSLPTR